MTDNWTVSLGARLDFARSTARASDLRGFSTDPPFYQGSLPGIADDFSDTSVLQQNNTLCSFYLTNKFKLDEHWTLSGGFGEGQRAPTLIERYADGLFISMLQSGLTRVVGDPSLKPERDWQIDLGLGAEYENWRGRISAFQAWIQDYITFEDGSVMVPRRVRGCPLAEFHQHGTGDPGRGRIGRRVRLVAAADPLRQSVLRRWARPRHQCAVARYFPPWTAPWAFGSTMLRRAVTGVSKSQPGWSWPKGGSATIRTGGSTELTVVEERTPGFAICNLRGYYNIKKNLHFMAGIDNVFDRNYQEHLDIRVSGPTGFVPSVTRVLEPGFSPYLGLNWVF